MFAKFVLPFISLMGFVSAQLPNFPDNIVVFPERDFITVEGFNGISGIQSFAGEQLTLQVVRNVNGVSVLQGEAVGTVSGTDIAFEVNHPGGYCWGAGSTLQATPDIRRGSIDANGVVTPGDSLILRHGADIIASTVVQNGIITGRNILDNVITIQGEVFGLVDPLAIEARIVAPALRISPVAFRDVRAVPGLGVVVNPGYSASLEIHGNTWNSTMTFFDDLGNPDPVTASIAFAGAFSVSTWQFTDVNGNAQGLTISEFGEAGGPMTANCPPYAGTLQPIFPDGVAYASDSIYWNPAVDQLGTNFPFNHYNVEILRPTADPLQTSIVGAARVDSNTRTVTFAAGLQTGDIIEVRAAQIFGGVDQVTSARKKVVFPITVADANVPTFSVADGGVDRVVTIASDQGLQIAYTVTDGPVGTPVALGTNALIYVDGTEIPITATQTISAIAFDTAGVISAAASATITNPYPAQVTGVTATQVSIAGANKIRVAWNALAGATGYKVYAIAGNVKTLVSNINVATATNTDLGAPTLSNNVAYTFTVVAYQVFAGVAYDGVGSLPSNAVVFVLTDVLTYTVRFRAATELRVSGTGSVSGAIISIYSGPNKTGVILGSGAVTNNAYDVRIKPIPAGITTITIASSMGFTVNFAVV